LSTVTASMLVLIQHLMCRMPIAATNTSCLPPVRSSFQGVVVAARLADLLVVRLRSAFAAGLVLVPGSRWAGNARLHHGLGQRRLTGLVCIREAVRGPSAGEVFRGDDGGKGGRRREAA
jgi:hypothetical protein